MKPAFNSFDEYVSVYPEAEEYRFWIAEKDPVFLPCDDLQDGKLPGGYVCAYVGQFFTPPSNPLYPHKLQWWVHINNNDDSCAKKYYATAKNATDALRRLVLRARAGKTIGIYALGKKGWSLGD